VRYLDSDERNLCLVKRIRRAVRILPAGHGE
jgi:hypothetical protein